jgi:hypothetical protein
MSLFEIINYAPILASSDPVVVGTQYQQALSKIISMLITGNAASMTDSFWAAIVTPSKFIAGLGVLFWLVPIVADLSFENLKNHSVRIVTLFFITFLFLNNAYGARMFAITNYGMIKAIDKSIADNLKLLGTYSSEVAAIKADNKTVQNISKQIQVCIKTPQTIADPDPNKPGNVIPNPTYVKCNQDVKAMIEAAKTTVSNPDLVASLSEAGTAADVDFDAVDYGATFKIIADAFNSANDWINKEIFKFFGSILDAWSVVIGELADEGFILSILALPIPLAFSFMNTKPLEIWFASLWGLAIFKFSMTILAAFIAFINANLSGSEPLFTLELGYAIGAPILAGVIARGGGKGIYDLTSQLSGQIVPAFTKV